MTIRKWRYGIPSAYETGLSKIARRHGQICVSSLNSVAADTVNAPERSSCNDPVLVQVSYDNATPIDPTTLVTLLNTDKVLADLSEEEDNNHTQNGEECQETTQHDLANQYDIPTNADLNHLQPILVVADKEAEGLPNTQFSVTDHAMADMIQACFRAGTSIGFLDDFLQILKKHAANGFNILKVPSRQNFMESLRKKVPHLRAALLLTESKLLVPKYSLLDQLKDLLSSLYFQKIEHAVVNSEPNIRFHQYIPPEHEGLEEVLGAKWYKDTYEKKIGYQNAVYTDPATNTTYFNWLTPLIFYIDKTGVGAMEGAYTLEPMMFTLATLRQSVREKDDAWRHLGFVPSYTHPKDDGTTNLKRYHECISAILSDVATLQRQPPLLRDVTLFGSRVNVRLILEVAYLMGDQESQDKHCARKANNGSGAARLHRSCMTSFMNADVFSHDHICHDLDVTIVKQLLKIIEQGDDKGSIVVEQTYPLPLNGTPRSPEVRQTKLLRARLQKLLTRRSAIAKDVLEKTYSLHPIKNAWHSISFGSNKNGIYRATLDDPMHYHCSGVVDYVLQVAFGHLKPGEAKQVEKIMREDFAKRSSRRYDFPRGKFSPGFSNCTLLTSTERIGLLHALYLSLGTERLERIYQASLLRQLKLYSECESKDSCGFPKFGDKHFFKDVRRQVAAEKAAEKARSSNGKKNDNPINIQIPRTKKTINEITKDLNLLGLAFVVNPDCPLDEVQTEYLISSVWDLATRQKDNEDIRESAQSLDLSLLCHLVVEERSCEQRVAFHLYQNLRHRTDDRKWKRRPKPTIEVNCCKHYEDRPIIHNRGETSAILTDVTTFRKVIGKLLCFYGIVHEHHMLENKLQSNFSRMQGVVNEIMVDVTSVIYRGDQTCDFKICKAHSHAHLARDTQEYGSPMNYDASKGERGLKRWAKSVSKTARKCGERVFIVQTADRVSDFLMLDNTLRIMNKDGKIAKPPKVVNKGKWEFTRKECHYRFHTGTKQLQCLDSYGKESEQPGETCENQLSIHLLEVVSTYHGNARLTLDIYKEVRIKINEEGSHHLVRAAEHYDKLGEYYDWCHVGANDMDYRVAKVCLLYQVEGNPFAIVWKTKATTAAERKEETNISARWSLPFHPDSHLPKLSVIPMEHLLQCVYAFEHFQTKKGECIPTEPTCVEEQRKYVVDETYDRKSWALNILDENRWK